MVSMVGFIGTRTGLQLIPTSILDYLASLFNPVNNLLISVVAA